MILGITTFMTKSELNFEDIMRKLLETARSDGKVSEEEEEFLEKLQKEVEKYQKSLEEASQNEMISDDEFHDLVILRDRILTDALEFETESENVNNMIQELFDEINNHTIPGMMEDEMSDD